MKKIEGSFSFQTCKTGRGKTRYLAKIVGNLDGKTVSAQFFGDWDGQLPANLALVNECGYRDPETGLIRSVTGALKGSVEFADDLPVVEKPGSVAGVTLRQIDLPDPDGFKLEKTTRTFAACTL